MSLRLGKECAVLDEQDVDGWTPSAYGISFRFKDGIAVYIDRMMAKRIADTFEFQEDQEGRKP